MVPEPPGIPVIEEITISDSSDDEDEASPSNNASINKENTPEKRAEKATDPLNDMSISRRLSNEYYNCDPLGDNCGSPRPEHENPTEDPLANTSIAESYCLDDRLNGDFIIVDEQSDLGINESDDEVVYMETTDASDHNTAARSNKNDDDSDKQLFIADDADDHTARSNNNDDDSDKKLYIADDTDPPDDNKTHVSGTNVTDNAVSKETEKSLSNENAEPQKEETMDCFENGEKTAEDEKIDVDEDSGDAENKLDVAPKDKESRMRVCLKQLLMPYCRKCKMPRSNTRGWTRRQRSDCITCGAELSYRCLVCTYEDSCLTKALWHVKRCCSAKLWRCYRCPYASVIEERVKAHIEYSHSNKENEDREDDVRDHWGYYRCNICRKGFKSLQFLRMHENYCGVERTVSIVKNEKPGKKEKTVKQKPVKPKQIRRRRKKKEPMPGVVVDDKKNADEYIKLHCYRCSLKFEKGKKEKRCDKCETPLLWLCVKCGTKSKSYCGLYDHVNNCTNEIAQLILV